MKIKKPVLAIFSSIRTRILEPYSAWLIFLVITGFILTAYGNSFTNEFVYDDLQFVVKNKHIRSLSNWPSFFSDTTTQSPTAGFDHYRPLITLSFALNYALGQLNPFVYHLTNFSFHLLNSFLVFWLIIILFKNKFLALVTTLFWGLHPVQTEAVSWVASRSSLMSATFYLTSVIAYLHWRRTEKKRLWLIVSVLTFWAGLFCKEMVVTLPVILILLDWLTEPPWQKLKQNWWVYTLFLTLGFLFWSIRFQAVGYIAMEKAWSNNSTAIFSTMIRVMGSYFRLLLWPLYLHIDHQFLITYELLRADVVFFFVLLVFLVFLLFFSRKKNPLLAFALGWFFIIILPVANIVPFSVIMAERFLYLPSVGYALLLAYLIKSFRGRSNSIVCGIIVIICLIYANLTWRQNKVWQNEFTLWSQLVKHEPANGRGHRLLGKLYLLQEKYELAEKKFALAVSLNPISSRAFNSLGVAYHRQQKYREAIFAFRKAIKLKPNYVYPYTNLGYVYYDLKDFEKMAAVLEEALPLAPERRDIYYNLVVSYTELGDMPKAKKYSKKYRELHPD